MKAKGKKFVSLFLVFSLLALSTNLNAKEKRGAELIVQKKDGQQVRGELIAVKEKSLLLLDTETGADVSIDIGDVWAIKVKKKSEILMGGSIGLVLGLLIGQGVGYPQGSETGFIFSKEEAGVIGAAIGGIIGAGIGVGIGASIGTDKEIFFYGKTQDEVERVLEKLLKKSRIPDYQ